MSLKLDFLRLFDIRIHKRCISQHVFASLKIYLAQFFLHLSSENAFDTRYEIYVFKMTFCSTWLLVSSIHSSASLPSFSLKKYIRRRFRSCLYTCVMYTKMVTHARPSWISGLDVNISLDSFSSLTKSRSFKIVQLSNLLVIAVNGNSVLTDSCKQVAGLNDDIKLTMYTKNAPHD